MNKTDVNIVGELNDPSQQVEAWKNQIKGLLMTLKGKDGRIIFEFGIPGLNKVVDVILLLDDKIFVLEYKNGSADYIKHDKEQTLGYALRLKYFHSESKDHKIIPILVATNASYSYDEHKDTDDGVYHLVLTNEHDLKSIIDSYCDNPDSQYLSWHDTWESGIFKATRSIISAAKNIWNKQHVKGLIDDTNSNTRSSELRLNAEDTIKAIVENAKANSRKALVFVTGVPGAGKTLVGLKISVECQQYGASLLSGNIPLVEVLSAALRKNLDIQWNNLKDEFEEELNSSTSEKLLERLKEKIAVDSIIRNVYSYKHEIIERLDYESTNNFDKYLPKPNTKPSSQHIVIYDEAQRAWSVSKMVSSGRTKKDWQTPSWNFSEPALLLWDMDQLDWGVFICLVGGGQEINEGESGINEWLRTIVEDHDKVNLNDWDVYMAPNLNGKEYQLTDGHCNTINDYLTKIQTINPGLINYNPTLHLTECQRSPLSIHLSDFINKLVDGDATSDDYKKIADDYTICLTRDVDTAKHYLRKRQRGLTPLRFSDQQNHQKDDTIVRTGILMSSSAARLRPLGFEIKKVNDYGKKTPSWFLDLREDNIDSSDFLEVALNEFFVQGLEIDLACIIWDADFRYDPSKKTWRFYKFNKRAWSERKIEPETGRTEARIIQKRESNNKKRITQAYMRNAYRVLLTRARLGMVICVPEGSADDATRSPEFYDNTFNYLKSLGLKII